MGITLAQFIVRGAIYSTAIIGGGYALMIATTPSPEKLKAEMDKYRELRGEAAMKIEEQQIASQMQLILLNAQSDHPAWDVRG
ncbi:hypothetical protein BC833DRAFT_597727 [Globomyces pollinis-pini]|nr:hypothetical protein BC833DRAFT_597727 [Globomyces pollinis-pini]